MGSRLVHRLNLFSDRDVLHAGVVAGLACIASAGLVYLGYFVHVWRVARSAPRGRVPLTGRLSPTRSSRRRRKRSGDAETTCVPGSER